MGIFLCALLVRLLYLFDSSDNPAFDSPVIDALAHHGLAQGVINGSGLEAVFALNRPFFYPLFLSALYSIIGPSILGAKIIGAVIGSATCALTFSIANKIWGRSVGIIAGAIAACYAPLFFWDLELVGAGWASFWSALLVLLLLRAREGAGRWPHILLGFCSALAVITRPSFALVVPLTWAWLLWTQWHTDRAWSAMGRRSGALLAGFLLVAGFTAMLSSQTMGGARLFPSTGSLNLFIGNNENSCETLTMRPGNDFLQLSFPLLKEGYKTPAQRSRWFSAKVREYAFANPGDFIRGLAHKAAQFANGREVPRNLDIYLFREWSGLLSVSVWKLGRFGFPWGVLLPLALVGLASQRRRIPGPIWIFLAAQPAVLILIFVAGRHRVPLVPLLCVLAGAGCWEIARELGRRNWRSAAIRIGAALLLAILFSLHPPSCEERVNYRSEFYALLSRSAFNKENWEEAQELLETALEYDPRSHDAHYRLGRVLAAKRQTAQAIVHFNKALAGNVDPRAFAERCRAHLRLHLIEKAEADCAAALALTPKNVLALLHQGDLDLMKGDVASARLNWKQVLARGGATGKIAKHRLSRHPEGSERKTLKELRASPDATESD